MPSFKHLLLASWLLFTSLTTAGVSQEPVRPPAGPLTQVPEVMPSITAGESSEVVKPMNSFEKCPTAQWIWGPDQNHKYELRRSFEASKIKSARLRVSCDNVVTVKVNGTTVGSSSNWQEPINIDITKHVREGANEIVAEAANQGGASGCLIQAVWVNAAGESSFLISDATWAAKDLSKPTESVAIKIVGKLGDQPWGNVFDGESSSGVPANTFVALPGFQVEKLFTVPKEQLGSWVAMTIDAKGRIIASDQQRQGLCLITPPPIGSQQPTKVEPLLLRSESESLTMTSVQGLLFAFDSLYLSINNAPHSGLYRARDTNQDGSWDEVIKLREFRGAGEHGPHALRLSPDGKHVVVICGNHTKPPFDVKEAPSQPEYRSRIPMNWSEDLLLPRQWDANGHAAGILAPGGWIAQTDPDGKTWEVLSMGYRNPYDMAYSPEGELFAYDADMEWDLGSPWYRPTRVVHATSGSEFGWRSGTGKWPTYYADSLPPVVDIGPGSPVGVEFGTGAKFPAKYQKALYICDWTFGTMYAIHLKPEGSTYRGEKEEFLSRTPLPLTDLAISPDGAMYFTVGGRGTQSELFRVTYAGKESTSPAPVEKDSFQSLRAQRREIEKLHAASPDALLSLAKNEIPKLIKALGHEDRFIRYAARVALERFPVDQWSSSVLQSSDAKTVITGCIGLARQGTSAERAALLASLQKLNFKALTPEDQLAYLRALQLVCIRMDGVDEKERISLLAQLEPHYPASASSESKPAKDISWVYAADLPHHDALNRELVNLLVYLKSEEVIHRTMPLMEKSAQAAGGAMDSLLARNRTYGGAVAGMMKNQPDLQQIHYAFALRNAKTGWTLNERKAYFAWFDKAHQWTGGASFQKFLDNISNDAYENATDSERLAVEAAGLRKPYQAPELSKPIGPGKAWTLEEVTQLAESGLKNRDLQKGAKAYEAARCVICHRFSGQGGATGPDLTQVAGRFSVKDLADAIINPSKVISDQYRASQIVTADGKVLTGRLISENEKEVVLLTDPESSSKQVKIARDDIESLEPSKVSLMPADLLNTLNQDEVLDMMAYLLSRGK